MILITTHMDSPAAVGIGDVSMQVDARSMACRRFTAAAIGSRDAQSSSLANK